jgi:MarR family transcriptional regulator, 2-MHQ and catechol-resistance regulon repressor
VNDSRTSKNTMGTHYQGSPKEIRALNAYIKLMRAADSLRGHLERHLAAHNLTENQFGALETIYHLGALHQHELGRKLFTSKGNLTALLDKLERAGLVRRERSQTDRRLIAVHLTEAGQSLVGSILPGHVAQITALMSVLDAREQRSLEGFCKLLGLHAQETREA